MSCCESCRELLQVAVDSISQSYFLKPNSDDILRLNQRVHIRVLTSTVLIKQCTCTGRSEQSKHRVPGDIILLLYLPILIREPLAKKDTAHAEWVPKPTVRDLDIAMAGRGPMCAACMMIASSFIAGYRTSGIETCAHPYP